MKSKKGKPSASDRKKKKANSSLSKKPVRGKSTPAAQSASAKRTARREKQSDQASGMAGEFQFWKRNWIPVLLLAVFGFVLYYPSVKFDYVLDDAIVLSENRFVEKGFEGIRDILGKDTFLGYKPYEGNEGAVVGSRYRPLSLVTFAIETQFQKIPEEVMAGVQQKNAESIEQYRAIIDQRKKVSHFINALLYALTAILLFRVIAEVWPEVENKRWFLGLAFVATALFVAHPLHVEAVANIKGRDEILALILALFTLFFSFRYVRTENILNLVVSGVMFYLGIMGKENAITFFAAIPLALWFFSKAKKDPLKILIAMIPLAAVVFIYIIHRKMVFGSLLGGSKPVTELMNNPFVEMTFLQRYAAIFHTLLLYVKLLFFPHPLTHDYYPYQIPIGNWGNWQSILGLLLYLGMFGVAIWQGGKNKLISFSIFFYLFTLSIVSNLVFPIGTFMNDRFMYMPSVGFCLLIGYLLTRKVPELMKGKEQVAMGVTLGVAVLFVAGFSVKTIQRVPVWENATTLNSAAIKVSTESARANQFYAYSLYEQAQVEPDREKKKALVDTAMVYVSKALEIYPGYTEALKCKAGLWGQYYNMNGKVQPLLDGFYEIIIVNPVPFTDTYLNWLNRKTQHANELVAFYHKVGYEYFWLKKQNGPMAKKYLNYGKQVAPGNPQILQDLAAIP